MSPTCHSRNAGGRWGRGARVRPAYVVLATLGLVIAGATYWRTRTADSRRDTEFERGAEAHLRNLDSLAMAPVSGPDDLASRLAGARVFGEAQVSDSQRASLHRAAGEFLDLYARRATAEELAAWRRREGYRPKSFDEIRAGHPGFDEQRRSGFGAGLSESAPWDEVWRAYLDACRRDQGDAAVPVKFALGKEGLAIGYSQATRANPGAQTPDLGIDDPLSFVGLATSSPSWWMHPEGSRVQLESRDRATAALVMLAAEFGGGKRRPVALQFVWASQQSRWALESVTTGERPGLGWGY